MIFVIISFYHSPYLFDSFPFIRSVITLILNSKMTLETRQLTVETFIIRVRTKHLNIFSQINKSIQMEM